jgi:tetratricopeptide (TPR) repeat protein
MEELTGELFDKGIEVADRRNLEYVYQELNFSMSGDVSDESAKSIGKFLAADMVVTGQLRDLGGSYRLLTTAIRVEEATRASVPRFDVRKDRSLQNMISALERQTSGVRTTKYGVSEDKTPQTAGTFIDRGIMFAMRGEYDKAVADFDEAIRLRPDMEAAYLMKARALSASVSIVTGVEENFSGFKYVTFGERMPTIEEARVHDQAIAAINQALRINPNNESAYSMRGTEYADKGDYDRALEDFNKAIQLAPNFVDAYSNRGAAYYYKKDYDRAIADFNQAIQLSPDFAGAYYNRGMAYFDKRDYDSVIADYTRVIELAPTADTYNSRGVAYASRNNTGDMNRAIADFEATLRIDPTNANATQNQERARQLVQ